MAKYHVQHLYNEWRARYLLQVLFKGVGGGAVLVRMTTTNDEHTSS